jgi:ATP-dependent DNA helicase RecG
MRQNSWCYQKQQQAHLFLSPQKRSIKSTTFNATTTTYQKNIRIPKHKKSENETSEIPTVVNTENGFSRPSLALVDKVIELLQKLEEPVGSLPGVGRVTQSLLTEQMNLPTIRSLLWNFPYSAIDRTKVITELNATNNLIKDGDIVTCIINVEGTFQGRQFLTLNCCIDGKPSDKIKVTFFYGSSTKGRGVAAGIKKQVFGSHHHQNQKKVVSGKIKKRGSKANISYEMVNPDIVCSIDKLDSALVVEPVYRLTKGLTQTKLRQTVKEAIKVATNLLEQIMPTDQCDTLPPNLRKALNWPTFVDALYAAHNPQSLNDVGPNSAARKRIAFEEMRVQQSQLALIRWHFKTKFPSSKQQPQKIVAPPFKSWQESPLVSLAISLLPFSLTDSQMNCLTEVWNDSIFSQASNDNNRMERVLQGDTGSGKTVVGYLSSLGCFEARLGGACVVAFLAPTTLLAEQHSQFLGKMVAKLNDALSVHRSNADSIKIKRIHVELLTRDVTGQKRAEIFNRFENCSENEAFFLVGTHALLTPETTSRLRNLQLPSNLGYGLCLSIIDEEQRFGVLQRESLTACSAHTLYLSATPVPRTLGKVIGRYS